MHDPRKIDGGVSGTILAHAELNALIMLPNEVDPHICILYTTTEPCPLCMGALYMSGLREFHYASRDPWAGSANLLGTTPYLSRKQVHAFGPERADLENIVIGMFVDVALGGGINNAQEVLAHWRTFMPGAIRFGEYLHQSGVLRQMDTDGLSVEEVITKLYRLMELP